MKDHPYAPGTRVLIRSNPHDAVENVVGTVVQFRPGAGVLGTDIVSVTYEDPLEGDPRREPFSPCHLRPAEPEALLQAADLYERHAAELRRLAEEESE